MMVLVWRLTRIVPDTDRNVCQEVHILGRGKSTVGRHNINKVICNSLLVSRRHCILNVQEDGTLTIMDLETSNGTFIGEQKVLSGREITLLNGDYIGIGCPAVGTVFEELYHDSENITRPFAFRVECTKSEDKRASLSLINSSEVSSINEKSKNYLVENASEINKRDTLNIQLGVKRPAPASENGCSPKVRKLSENGIQQNENIILDDNKMTVSDIVVNVSEPCTSTGVSKQSSTEQKNINNVAAYCNNVKAEAKYDNSKKQDISLDNGTEKLSDNSESVLHDNILDNKKIVSWNIIGSHLGSEAKNNVYGMPGSSDKHSEIKLTSVKDNKLYTISEKNVKLEKFASTVPNNRNHETLAISEKSVNLKKATSAVTGDKNEKEKSEDNSVLSLLSYSLEDSVICLDSDDEMPSSQIFDDVQIKIEPTEDTSEDNKEEWEYNDGDDNGNDDYDEISVIAEDFDRPWIDRLTTTESFKISEGKHGTERDCDSECVFENKCPSANKVELSMDVEDDVSDKIASRKKFDPTSQNIMKSEHTDEDVIDLTYDKREKVKGKKIMGNDIAHSLEIPRNSSLKGSKRKISDIHCNLIKKETHNTESDKIVKQSVTKMCYTESSNRLKSDVKSFVKGGRAAVDSKINENKHVRNFKTGVVQDIASKDAAENNNSSRNNNTTAGRQSDSEDENIETYNTYRDFKNTLIQNVISYRNNVHVPGEKNDHCKVLLEDKGVKMVAIEECSSEDTITQKNKLSIKEKKGNSLTKKAILVDAAPLLPKQTKRRKAKGVGREQTVVESGKEKTNEILKKKKLREIAEKQNLLAARNDIKTNRVSGSAKIKMTHINRGDRLVNEIVTNTRVLKQKKSADATSSFVDYKIPKKGTEDGTDSNFEVESKMKIMELRNSSDDLVRGNSKQRINPSLSEPHSGGCLKNITNIAAPAQSTSSRRKVTFSTNVIVHEIEFIETCKRKPVKKDVPLIVQNPTVQKPNKVLCKDRTVLSYPEDTIYDVCSWNILWCEEQQRLPSTVIPPLCSQVICDMKDDFVSFEDYRRCLYPLLLLELWASISTSHNSLQSKRFLFNAAVDDTRELKIKSSIPEKPGEQPKMFLIMTCHLLLTQELYNQNSYPRYGDIIGIEFTVLPDSNCKKKIIERRFAYVSGARCVPFDDRRNFPRQDLLTHCPTPKYIVYMTLSIKGRGGRAVDKSVFVKIRPLKNIVSDLRVFQALEMLPNSPLCNVILSPATNHVDVNVDDTKDAIYYSEAPLNKSQTKAVLTAAKMCVEGTTGISFIHGPPGTGKSHVIVSLIMQIWLSSYRKSKPRILLCAPSNAAVDEVVARLLKIRQTLSESKRFRIVRNGRAEITNPQVRNVSVENLAERELAKDDETQQDNESCELEVSLLKANQRCISLTIDYYKGKNQDTTGCEQKLAYITKKINDYQNPKQNGILADEKRRKRKEKEIILLQHANIIATTLSSCFNSQMENAFRYSRTLIGEENLGFTCCIVDEATQCSEADTLIPLMLGIKTLVLVGDPKQLPATILSPVAKEKGLGKSLFARNYAWMSSREGRDHAKLYKYPVHLLDTQYRMHPAIAEWPSCYFYSRKLHTEPIMEQLRRSPLLPYVILSLESDQADTREENAAERKVITNLLNSIIKKDGCRDMTFGVVTPYQKQRQRLINDLKGMNALSSNVEVGTIDSFQGRERDVIIISCVRTDGIGFLSDPQRLNVALTRARSSLIVCGNFRSLEKDHTWMSLLSNARKRKVLKHVNQEMVKHSEHILDLVAI